MAVAPGRTGSHHLPGARGSAPQNPGDVQEWRPLRPPPQPHPWGRGADAGHGAGGREGRFGRGHSDTEGGLCPCRALRWLSVSWHVSRPRSHRPLPRRELGTALGEAPPLHIAALTARAPDPVKRHGSASFHPNKTAVMNRGSCRQLPLLSEPRHCAAGSEGTLRPPRPCALPRAVTLGWDAPKS